MYEGWHITLTDHARRRMEERHVDLEEVSRVIGEPQSVDADAAHGGKLLARYLPDWDRILIVAVHERASESVLVVKTVLWSKVN